MSGEVCAKFSYLGVDIYIYAEFFVSGDFCAELLILRVDISMLNCLEINYFQLAHSNQLQFITWTSPDLDPASDSELCTVPPHIGIEVSLTDAHCAV